MKEILSKPKKGNLIEIYTYKEDFSSIGIFLGSNNKYAILEIYDYAGKRKGIKLIHRDAITRVSFDSNFLKTMAKRIENRKKDRQVLSFHKKDFFAELFKTIIDKEIFLQIKFGDENQMGYLRKIDEKYFHFDLVEKNLKICSKEIVVKDYYGLKMEITRDIIENITIKDKKTNDKNLLIEHYWNEIEGNIVFQTEEYTLFCEKENIGQDYKFSIMKTEEVENKERILKNRNTEYIDISQFIEKFENSKINEILKICKENKIMISMMYKYESKEKTGIIEKIEKDKIILKEFDMKIADFSYDYEISKNNIEMLHIREIRIY